MKKKFAFALTAVMAVSALAPVMASADEQLTGIVDGDVVNIRAGQGTNTAILTQVTEGTVLDVYADYGDWAYVWANGRMGYISTQYFDIQYDDSSAMPPANGEVPANPQGQAICDYAAQFLGIPYLYGGSSPSTGFDCSGFTQYVFAHFGISINRVAADQANNGVYVAKEDLQPGDLVFFGYYGSSSIGHVGIYVGNGQFIHSPSSGKSIMYSSLDNSYYQANYITARRVIS